MNDFMKGILMLLVVLYIVSPIDACPGPIDDIIVLMMALASRKSIAADND